MRFCKGCKHESWCHQAGEGQCDAVLIKSESEFYEVDMGAGIKAIAQDVEYGDDCDCPRFI